MDIKKFLEIQFLFRSASKADVDNVLKDLSESTEEPSAISESDVKYFVLLDDILSEDVEPSSMFGKYKN